MIEVDATHYYRHRFPADIIAEAAWQNFPFHYAFV